MLDSEWTQLVNQLNKSRGSETRFFSFVDTISARNYAGTNEPHGWVGLRFQLQPGGQPNDIILHINLRDPSNTLEQEAIGILGVNLIYAVFYQLETKESFFENIAQDVEKRIEIDYVEVRGPAFEGWDQRAILAQLVCAGLAEAVCFPCSGPPVPPIEVLHKKATRARAGIVRTHRSLLMRQSIINCWPPGSSNSAESWLKKIPRLLVSFAFPRCRSGKQIPLRESRTCWNGLMRFTRIAVMYCCSVNENSTV